MIVKKIEKILTERLGYDSVASGKFSMENHKHYELCESEL